MAFCTGCGNEVPDPARCPICADTRERHRHARALDCPRCREPLDQQDWEGTATLCCAVCRGTFFPSRGLETVLNKLRASCDPIDLESVLKDFKDRFRRELPDAVRYKPCPVCDSVMTRRNYGSVSGVIVDVCNDHGTWVDEQAFAALADFICRGGDILAQEAGRVRARADQRHGPGFMEKLFGRD